MQDICLIRLKRDKRKERKRKMARCRARIITLLGEKAAASAALMGMILATYTTTFRAEMLSPCTIHFNTGERRRRAASGRSRVTCMPRRHTASPCRVFTHTGSPRWISHPLNDALASHGSSHVACLRRFTGILPLRPQKRLSASIGLAIAAGAGRHIAAAGIGLASATSLRCR